MGKRSPGPMSYIREASALRNIKLCYAGRSFSIRVVSRCLQTKQPPVSELTNTGGRLFKVEN